MVRSRHGRARRGGGPAVARRPISLRRPGTGGAGLGVLARIRGRGRPTGTRLARLPRPGRGTAAGVLGLAVILAAAGLLRLWALDAATLNPFYDAAVRSMGRSWHNFFFGALEPGGRISVDKP